MWYRCTKIMEKYNETKRKPRAQWFIRMAGWSWSLYWHQSTKPWGNAVHLSYILKKNHPQIHLLLLDNLYPDIGYVIQTSYETNQYRYCNRTGFGLGHSEDLAVLYINNSVGIRKSRRSVCLSLCLCPSLSVSGITNVTHESNFDLRFSPYYRFQQEMVPLYSPELGLHLLWTHHYK